MKSPEIGSGLVSDSYVSVGRRKLFPKPLHGLMSMRLIRIMEIHLGII